MLANSDWGKGLLTEILFNIGLLTSLSVSEVEKAFEGNPIGRSSLDFKNCWVINFDEFKKVNSEIKQLASYIEGSPKNQMRFRAEIYMKLFTSAKSVASLTGDAGVEKQFSNRFSLIPTQVADIKDRPLFMNGKAEYAKSIQNYIADKINQQVSIYVPLGKDAASNKADKILTEYNHKNDIAKHFGSLDDTVAEIAKAIQSEIAAKPNANYTSLNFDSSFEKALNGKLTLAKYKGQECYVLKHAGKVASAYIDDNYERSEVVKVKYKRDQILKLMDESGRKDLKNPIKVHLKAKKQPQPNPVAGQPKQAPPPPVITFEEASTQERGILIYKT